MTTYLSRNDYPDTSIVTNFAVTFPYLSRDHVIAVLDEVEIPFTWINDGLVQISPAPVGDLQIRRKTPKDARLVTFSNTAFLRDSNLNKADLQLFYLIQEDADEISDLIGEGGSILGLEEQLTEINSRLDALEQEVDDVAANLAFNYYTKTEVTDIINGYYTNPELDAMFAAKQAQIDSLDGRVDVLETDVAALETDLDDNYYTKTEVDATIAALELEGITWRGDWNSSNSYAVNDAVAYQGSSFIAKVARSPGHANPLADSTNWDIIAEKGANGTSSYGVRLYFQDVPASGIPGYFSLVSTFSDATERTHTGTANIGTGDVLIAAYITEPGFPGLTIFPSGNYEFRFYRSVSDASQVTQLVMRAYIRTALGVETMILEKIGAEINDTTTTLETITHFGPGTTPLNTDDRIVIKLFARSTSPSNKTISFVHSGSTSASHVNTPFAISGSNGKSAYQVAVDNGFVGSEAAWLASLQGADGADGVDGTDGKSAYEVAVDNGFVGTEAAWLASLEGADGAPGTAGSGQIGGHVKFGTSISAPSGNWVVPAGVTKVRVRLWGGGGSGGRPSSGNAGGGGGGAFTEAIVTVTPGANLAYSVGTGGTATSGTGQNGNSGGTTTLSGSGFSLSAAGGSGGGSSGTNGAGGATTTQTGDTNAINREGGPGGFGTASLAGYGGSAAGGGGPQTPIVAVQPAKFPGGGSSSGDASTNSGAGAIGSIVIDF